MRTTGQPTRTSRSRPAGVVPSATALIALVAVAALMTSASSATVTRATSSEARHSLREGDVVRAVAAAVAAAARDLMAGNRLMNALPAEWSPASAHPAELASRPRIVGDARPARCILAARLLDLPPPCR